MHTEECKINCFVNKHKIFRVILIKISAFNAYFHAFYQPSFVIHLHDGRTCARLPQVDVASYIPVGGVAVEHPSCDVVGVDGVKPSGFYGQ